MKPETLKALRAEIRRWHGIYRGEVRDLGLTGNSLCRLFLDLRCYGCPVYKRTGLPFCRCTPFKVWHALTMHLFRPRIVTKEEKKAAKEEWEFLRSLLPPTKKPCTRRAKKPKNEDE